jgi:hypothetical protein
MMEENCANCKFWASARDEDGPEACLRYPPVVYQTKDGHHDFTWPDTNAEDWCGEWKAEDAHP